MNFQLSEDQKALQEGIRSFCEGVCPIEKLVELEHGPAVERALWGELAEMGVFNLRTPEADGGVGLGTADAVLVFAELGRRLVPGPIVWSHLACNLIEGAGTGDTIVGGLDLCGPDAGEPVLVEHLESLDVLLALRKGGIDRIDPKSLKAEAVGEPLDPLTPLHHVAQLPEGERIGDAAAAARLRLEGAALVSGLQLGIAEATLELATEYAKGRHQFDRPIGGIMAVKHLLADMFVRQEVARAAVYNAGATLDTPEVGDVARAVGSAKVNAGVAALRNSRSCIQVHGGMGYTWEVPAHYYLKRSWVLGDLFGGEEEHSEKIAEIIAAST